MKVYIFLLLLLSSASFGYGQNGEFTVHSNGLIYSDTTMTQLKYIVDSLNLKFKVCDLDRVYFSKYQACAFYIKLDSGDIKKAKNDIENEIALEDFLKKYPEATVLKDLLVVKHQYKSYENEDITEYSTLPLGKGYQQKISTSGKPEHYRENMNGKWIYSYWEGSEYSKETVRGFYFISDFEKKPLPEKYARMVQYSNCMVDTNAQVFKEDAKRNSGWYELEKASKVKDFLDYVVKELNVKKQKNRSELFQLYLALEDTAAMEYINNQLSKQEKFNTLLSDAVDDALENGGSNGLFEEFVGRYYSPKTQLELKRGRIVVGSCSMDDSPRRHAVDIAVLSAETVSWEVFLRAHLDIMNDRFERMSDGSYAWAGRKTYIRELEVLDINVVDLLLGISFRIENPSQNHYFGSIWRIGRALAETQNPEEVENKMLSIIKDGTLDDYNRMLIYFLFLSYNSYLEDESRRKSNRKKLKAAVNKLPVYIAEKIEFEEE